MQTSEAAGYYSPQESVEPRHGALALAELVLSLERLDEGGLQQLLGGGPAACPRLEKPQEALVLRDEDLDDVGRDGPGHTAIVARS
jgi:hypothetical protein